MVIYHKKKNNNENKQNQTTGTTNDPIDNRKKKKGEKKRKKKKLLCFLLLDWVVVGWFVVADTKDFIIQQSKQSNKQIKGGSPKWGAQWMLCYVVLVERSSLSTVL